MNGNRFFRAATTAAFLLSLACADNTAFASLTQDYLKGHGWLDPARGDQSRFVGCPRPARG